MNAAEYQPSHITPNSNLDQLTPTIAEFVTAKIQNVDMASRYHFLKLIWIYAIRNTQCLEIIILIHQFKELRKRCIGIIQE